MNIPTIIVSSTIFDLPDHRKFILDACLRQGFHPLMMEHLSAGTNDAVHESMQLVEKADIYLGVFGHRYGYVPPGYDISITEIEYLYAKETNKIRLIFLMGDQHPITIKEVEGGVGAEKLRQLKSRLKIEQVVEYFNSVEELRTLIINALSKYRRPNLGQFHYISDIPEPPEAYIAHPYSLLQTKEVIGRQKELNQLTEWVSNPKSALFQNRVFAIVAIGGMGKSALTWKWFQQIAPNEMRSLEGRIWWSFYESDATFENFIIRTLAYVKCCPKEEILNSPAPGREAELLNILDKHNFLIVLDGLERILVAYSRLDAATLKDDDLEKQCENYVPEVPSVPVTAYQSFIGRHRLRSTADPRAGIFLRKLTSLICSRILITTRLFPAELQTEALKEVNSVEALILNGLSNDDAVNLWREFEVTGNRAELIPLFNSFENYPLLVRALAGEVAKYRPAPGNFEKWKKSNPKFNPYDLPMIQRKSHILEYALRGLGTPMRKVLMTISAFRMPSNYHTLTELLVGSDRTFVTEDVFDKVLTELEDRGLMGWDRRANRYDLHPIVRGVIWHGLGQMGKRIIYQALQSHFEALPAVETQDVQYLEDLTPAIELFNALINLRMFDDAYTIWDRFISDSILYYVNNFRVGCELLEAFFETKNTEPSVSDNDIKADILNSLGIYYTFRGWHSKAEKKLLRAIQIKEEPVSALYNNMGIAALSIYKHELYYRKALKITDFLSEPVVVSNLISILIKRNEMGKVIKLIHFFKNYIKLDSDIRAYSLLHTILGRYYFLNQQNEKALKKIDLSLNNAIELNLQREIIRAILTKGEIEVSLAHNAAASESLLVEGLNRARMITDTLSEIGALLSLAELYINENRYSEAIEVLEDLSILIRGETLYESQSRYFLAQAKISLSQNKVEEAVDLGKKSYLTAWELGPPYSHYWNLRVTEKFLHQLGVDKPNNLSSFDWDKYEKPPNIKLPDKSMV